jgi:ABC-2 type transport system permease protein
MRLQLELIRLAFRRHLAYRAAALAGLATNFFFGLLRAAVMVALYGERQEMQGVSLEAAITYTGLSQAVIGPLAMFSWLEVTRAVHSGEVASDLLKPMGYYGFWLARDIGRALATFLWRSVTILLAYVFMFRLLAPPGAKFVIPRDPWVWLAVVLACVLAWWVSFSWRFLANVSAFWSPDARGIVRLAFIFSWFASGFIMPLRFYPDWVVDLCMLTPFPHTVNSIVEIYLGLLEGPEILSTLGLQLAWAVALCAACLLALRAGVRRLVILGG